MVVAEHCRGVGIGVLQIVQVVVGILQIGLQCEVLPSVFVRRLHEEVLVPLAVGRIPLVGKSSDDGSGESALRVVVVHVCGKSAIESGCFDPIERDVGVVSLANGVLLLRAEAETVVAFGVLIFGIDKHQVLQREITLHLVQSKRAASVLQRVCSLGRTSGLHIYRCSRGILRCRLQAFVAVGVVERYRLHIAQRVASEVNLSVLRIVDAYAVEIHSHVLRT